MSISAVILTKNEEKNVAECLQTLVWCDEILIIDDNSTDKTVEIAKKQKAIVFTHSLDSDFAQSRNFGLEKAKGDWIFFVDADEHVSEKLKAEIVKRIQNNTVDGFFLKREDVMWGKVLKHGEQGNGKFLRLARKKKGEWSGKVHEVWNIAGTTSLLRNPLLHYPHPTLAEFLTEINFYSTLRAKELFEHKEKATWLSILIYPKAKFFQNYFLKRGFLDGTPGFIVAVLMSLHSFLVRGKLWQLNQK